MFPALVTIELMYTFTLVEAATLERTFVPGSVFTTDVMLGFLIGTKTKKIHVLIKKKDLVFLLIFSPFCHGFIKQRITAK